MNRVRDVVLTGAAAAALLLAPVGASAYGDAKGPPCSDMTDVTGSNTSGYSTDTSTGENVVTARITLAAPACASITYTFHVLDAAGTTTLLTIPGTTSVDAQHGPIVSFRGVVPDGHTNIKTFASTSRGDRLVDRGPNDGFIDLSLNGSGAPRTYN